jgi:predicted nucleic acid-binding protein
MRVVVDTNVFISATLKEKSLPGTAVHLVAKGGLLLKSTITERELFVTGPPASGATDPAALPRLAE